VESAVVDLLTGLDFWGWWVLGLLLAGIEVFAPGMVFLWLGVSAGVVGLALLAVPSMDWRIQWLLFALLSVASVTLARLWLRRHPLETDRPTLNRRGQQYVGRSFTLGTPIENGHGRLVVDDTTWRIVGPDLPAGARVKVVGADGATLQVEGA